MAIRDIATLEQSGVRDVALSPDQTLLYAAMSNGNVNVYNLVTQEKIATWDVGNQLGGISVSTDGSFLLVVERQPAANSATFYRVDTATGASTAVTVAGSAYRDVEIVDADTAILTGYGNQNVYNVQTGQFSATSIPFGFGSVFTEDQHYTLVAYPGSSDGPLALFDDRTNTIVAQGSSYQAMGNSGFNWGSQAISEAAGLVLQFIYYGSINVYNMNLGFVRTVPVGERVDGLVFDPTGKYVYAYLIDSGVLAKYDLATWTRVADFSVGTSSWHNDIGYGNQLLINADGTRITIVDSKADIGKLRVVNLAGSDNNSFYGTPGADTFAGGIGDDFYFVNHEGDTVTELAGEGEDSVESGIYAYTLDANVENLTGVLSYGQWLQGNALNNRIAGGSGSDFLVGHDGDDRLSGGAGNDLLEGGRGVDSFDGGANFDGYWGDQISFYESGATQGVVADLRTGIISNDGFGNSETMTGIESFGFGTAFADTFYGDDNVNGLLVERGDFAYGFGGDDHIQAGLAPAVADGGAGTDTLFLRSDEGFLLPDSDGDGTAERSTAMTSGWKVDLVAGTIRDGFGNQGVVTGIEHLYGTDLADDLRGDSGDNGIEGNDGNDLLRLHDGGDDAVYAGDGADGIFFGAALTAADVVNGGAGGDTLVLQGPYGSLTLGSNVTQIENVSILGGNNTNLGEPGTNRYDYVLTTSDSNFAAGVQARINAAALLADEDFTFDGSAETDANYVVYGGRGKDTLLGGQGNDIFFYAEERFASGDTVNGGAGYDGMFLRGNYTIDFNAPGYTGLFTNIENLTLTSATDERYARGGGTEFDYNLTLSNAIVNAGQTLTISGSLLLANETMILDASQESDGFLRLFGGKANDTLKGGALNDLIHGNLGADILAGNGGADAFRYQDVAESTGASMDQILDFTAGTDRIELDRIDANAGAAGDQAFSWIGSGAFTGTAGQLRAYEQNGTWLVEGDTNGDSVADLVIALTLQGQTPLGAGDFIL
jgi:Ca2+-binding RTX toxin-like protein